MTNIQGFESLLNNILLLRRAAWRGKSKYREPDPPETKNLAPIPSHWCWASPAQLSAAEPHSLAIGPFGSDLKVSDYRAEGVPLVFVRNIRSGTFNGPKAVFVSPEKADDLAAHQVSGGDILITKMGEPPGDACLYPETCPTAVITADCIKLRLSQGLSPKFFTYAINAPVVRNQIGDITKGVAQQKVSLGRFSTLALPLPPLDDQQRIVAEIEKQFTRLDAGVASLKRVQAALKRYRASVLKAACEGRLVPTEAELARRESRPYEPATALLARILEGRREKWNGRGKYREPLDSRHSGYEPEGLPEGWVCATIDALAEVKGGVTKDQKRKHTTPARMVRYLRVANVQRGHLDLTEVKQIEASEADIQELALKQGDILFNEGGDRDKLGRGWIWNDEIPECIHQNHVFRARLFDRQVNPKFVSWYANSFGQKFFFDEGKHTTNLASISMSKLKGLPIPLPPLAEQHRIVAEVERRLSVIDELELALGTDLMRVARLRTSILAAAFRGSLCP